MPDHLQTAQDEIRAHRAREWQEDYKRRTGKPFAPEPTDENLNWPEPMVSVTWEHGYITMTLDAYDKLKAKDMKLFNKLGGMY